MNSGFNPLLIFFTINRLAGLLTFFLLPLIFTGCQDKLPKTEAAFYHWQTQLSIDSLEQEWLHQTQSQRLYVKFFDVDWDNTQQSVVPKAELILETSPQSIEIVPAIFITNRSFLEIADQQIPVLAEAIFHKINALWPELTPSEIQIDCDWTERTQLAYFRFLEQFHSLLPPTTTLSATIRLHQYRYPKQTGIPPVDRGMLMYYNMGELADWTETNSILNLDKAAPYLDAEAYPLDLDLALPLFRWGVLFREGRMIKLINKLTASEFDKKKIQALKSIPELGSSRWLVTEDHYLNGYFLYKGDQIRLEYITTGLLEKAALQLKQIQTSGDRYLSFYHLDGELLNVDDFSPADLLYFINSASF